MLKISHIAVATRLFSITPLLLFRRQNKARSTPPQILNNESKKIGFIYLTVESIEPNLSNYELAQKAVKKAEDMVEKAENELRNMNFVLTQHWFEEKNCVEEGKRYLETGEWNIEYPKYQLDFYLSGEQRIIRKEEALIVEKQNLALEKQNLARKEEALAEEKKNAIAFPPFDPKSYQVSFPFFVPNGESHLNLLERDNVVAEINEVVLPNRKTRSNKNEKYWPIIISTSRGMGKTFLLKMVGMQKVKKELKNVIIEEALSCGRILSFDFVKNDLKSEEDVLSFFPRLMIYFLCYLFNGKQVDGINFDEIAFDKIVTSEGNQLKFKIWKKKYLDSSTDIVIQEYIRLTNIAFDVDPKSECYNTPPVFLLDEIQTLCKPTNRKSEKISDGNGPKIHSYLTYLLTQLAGKHRPICICTGTNNGDIVSICEMSSIIPEVLSLTPLLNDYKEYWTEMTEYSNINNTELVQMAGDEDLIDCLISASYKIPRLLFIAHSVWFKLRQEGIENREYYLQYFQAKAKKYYNELGSVLQSYNVETLSRIILCCGVHWRVENIHSCVPGTSIKWNNLIQSALIFPYADNCYLFPFTLVWSNSVLKKRTDTSVTTQTDYENCNERNTLTDAEFDELEAIKTQIKFNCNSAVGNLNIEDLHVSFDILCKLDIKKLGIFYESLFVASLAAKYYLYMLSNTSKDRFVPFSKLYDFNIGDASKVLMSQFNVNLSEGILLPQTEAFVTDDLNNGVIHNKLNNSAHHDIIIPTNLGRVAVSAKASFNFNPGDMNMQWQVSKTSNAKVIQLILLYLGSLEKEKKQPNVAFLDGSGVCSGLSLDTFILVKKLKSQNNL